MELLAAHDLATDFMEQILDGLEVASGRRLRVEVTIVDHALHALGLVDCDSSLWSQVTLVAHKENQEVFV